MTLNGILTTVIVLIAIWVVYRSVTRSSRALRPGRSGSVGPGSGSSSFDGGTGVMSADGPHPHHGSSGGGLDHAAGPSHGGDGGSPGGSDGGGGHAGSDGGGGGDGGGGH